MLLALLLQLAGLADNNPPESGSELPTPEYIDADIVLMERGVAPELNRAGLAQPEPAEDPEPEPRYAPITPEERELIARVVHLEANNQPFEGQQAVAEVILNRRAAANFPDTVEAVIYQENPVQFTVTPGIPYCAPTAENYAAVDDDDCGYHVRAWDADTGARAKYTRNPALDRIYALLERLGYEMSDEEIELQNGTHTEFTLEVDECSQ